MDLTYKNIFWACLMGGSTGPRFGLIRFLSTRSLWNLTITTKLLFGLSHPSVEHLLEPNYEQTRQKPNEPRFVQQWNRNLRHKMWISFVNTESKKPRHKVLFKRLQRSDCLARFNKTFTKILQLMMLRLGPGAGYYACNEYSPSAEPHDNLNHICFLS